MVQRVCVSAALLMMRSDGVESLVNALRPDLLSMPDNSHERLIVYKFVILLLDRMFSVIREPINAKTEPSPRVTRNTLECVYFYNITYIIILLVTINTNVKCPIIQ